MTPDPDCLLDQTRLTAVILEATRCALLGDLAEFGVFKGGTAIHLARIAKAAGRKLHLFDSWQGLSAPTLSTERNLAGALASPKEYCVEKLRAADVLDCCVFRDGDIMTHFESVEFIAFAHVDLDMYEPTMRALDYCMLMLHPEGAVIVDDYENDKFAGVTAAVDRLNTETMWQKQAIGISPNRSAKITFR